MIPSRRRNLSKEKLATTKPSHPGLWLDKYMERQLRKGESIGKNQRTPTQQLVDSVASINVPANIYIQFYERWKQALKQNGAQTRIATVRGRMIVGLGAESVLETSVALHRTYGVPYIPGSALKGLAAAHAHQRLKNPKWRKGGEAYQVLFGDTTTAGYITFYDALYVVPDSQRISSPLSADVITVHHPKYYQGSGQPPADWDSPTPIPFLSATGQYLIALAGPTQDWIDRAFGILQLALGVMGIGAKTSSGYGRLHFEAPELEAAEVAQANATPVALPVTPEQARVNSMVQQVQQLRSSDVAGQIPNHAERWAKLDVAESLKLELARAILTKVHEAGREKASLEKAWYQQIKAYVEQNDSQ